MSERPRRTLHLLVVSPDGNAVVVDEHGALPQLDIEVDEGGTTAGAVRRALAPRFGAEPTVLEMLFDDTPDADPAVPLPTLVDLVPPPPGWTPTPPHRWQPTSTDMPTTHPRFTERVRRLLDERRGRLPVHPLRSPWSRPGWYDEITTWIDHRLVAAGRPASSTVTQFRHWGISALLRATSGDDVVWCKAVFPPFRAEPTVTARLHQDGPGTVAPVIAIEPERGWLLMEDVGVSTFEERLDTPAPAIAAMTAFHRRYAGRVEDLVAAGLPDRRLGRLPSAAAEALTDPEFAALHGFAPERVAEVVAWLEHAVGVLVGLGLPDTLVHGDFHPGNVVSTDAGVVVFDWSDAAVSCPVVDVVTWQWWCSDDACRDRTWDAFLAGWQGLVDRTTVDEHRVLCEGVAAAHHVVSYAAILRGLEPDRRPETASGLTDFAARLSRAVPQGN